MICKVFIIVCTGVSSPPPLLKNTLPILRRAPVILHTIPAPFLGNSPIYIFRFFAQPPRRKGVHTIIMLYIDFCHWNQPGKCVFLLLLSSWDQQLRHIWMVFDQHWLSICLECYRVVLNQKHEGTVSSIHKKRVITGLDIMTGRRENLILWYKDLTQERETWKLI